MTTVVDMPAINAIAAATEEVIRQAQMMISDAQDIAERLLVVIHKEEDRLYVVALDECDRKVEFLCDGPFGDWRMARTAIERVKERLNQQDPALLAGLLAHCDFYTAGR